jgi:hypothetical protein
LAGDRTRTAYENRTRQDKYKKKDRCKDRTWEDKDRSRTGVKV